MGRLDSIENWIALARQAAYSADILANVCGVSASHLRRHFHSIFRRSPQDWLNELRLWHAMQLVCEGMLIKQVAANLNFSGASHLCNRFREYHGCTPRECYCLFRKRQKRFGVEGTGNDVMLPWKAAEYRLGIQVRDNTVVVNFNVDSQCQADVLLAGRVS